MNPKIQFYRALYRFLTFTGDDKAVERALLRVMTLHQSLKDQVTTPTEYMTRVELMTARWDYHRTPSIKNVLRLTLIYPAFTDLVDEQPQTQAHAVITKFLELVDQEILLCSRIVKIKPIGKTGMATFTVQVTNPALFKQLLNLSEHEDRPDNELITCEIPE